MGSGDASSVLNTYMTYISFTVSLLKHWLIFLATSNDDRFLHFKGKVRHRERRIIPKYTLVATGAGWVGIIARGYFLGRNDAEEILYTVCS